MQLLSKEVSKVNDSTGNLIAHIVTMILIEGFNHEITTAQLRLSEIVVKYSRPSWRAQFSKHFLVIANWLEILEKPDNIRFSSPLSIVLLKT